MTLGTPLVDPTPDAGTTEAAKNGSPQSKLPVRRHKRDRRTRRLVFGLTGVLGFAWAVVIASRYSGLMAG